MLNKIRSILILGYGREGRSVHRYLYRRYPNLKIGIADQNKIEPEIKAGVNLHLGRGYLQSLKDYDLIVRSPGIALQTPEIQRAKATGKIITSATKIFFAKCPGMTIGITGSLGKSTTSSLIATILTREYPDVRLAGNIGVPMLDRLEGANEKTIFVLELSSFQLEDLDRSPHIAVLLNIVPEHLDRHQTFANYVRAKSNIINHQNRKNFVVFNPQHQVLTELTATVRSQKINFTLGHQPNSLCFFRQGKIFIRKEKQTIPLIERKKIPLLGEGNTENAMAAISVALILKVPLAKIREALVSFKPLEHRLEYVGKYQRIKFYNDSISTVPESAIHALKALGDQVETLIAGGYDRGLDFSPLARFLTKTKVANLILFPPSGKRIWQAVTKLVPQSKCPRKFIVSSMEEAVEIAFRATSPGKICLLSPASASFGLFRDYRERGELFKKLVLNYQKEK